jgi:hypothetical protein
MTRKFAFLLAVVLCSTSAVLIPDRASAQTNLTRAVIQRLRNQVKLIPKQGRGRPARVQDKLYPQDALSTSSAARAELRFNDGSLARIGERTLFRFTPRTRRFQLDNGTVLLLIPPKRGRTQVKTPNAAAGIRGSALFVRYDPDTDTTLIGALTDSQIEVSNKDETQTQPLEAGQLAVVVKDKIERLYEFDLRTFYETSSMVEGLDLTGKETSTDPDIAAVQQETVQAVQEQTPIVGSKFSIDQIAKVPEVIPVSLPFSSPERVVTAVQQVDNPNNPVNIPQPTSRSDDPEPASKPLPGIREEDGEQKGPIRPDQPDPAQPGRPPAPGPIGGVPPKEGGNQGNPPGNGSGMGDERPKDGGSPNGPGSGGQNNPPRPDEGSGERPNPVPPKGEGAGGELGENRKPSTEHEHHSGPHPEIPENGQGNQGRPPVLEAPSRPTPPANPGQPEASVRSPNVSVPAPVFSPPKIIGNTDPNPNASAPLIVIDPIPPAAVGRTPNNPASVPTPPSGAPASTPAITHGGSNSTPPSAASSPATSSPVVGGSSSSPPSAGVNTPIATPPNQVGNTGNAGATPGIIAPNASSIDPSSPAVDPFSGTPGSKQPSTTPPIDPVPSVSKPGSTPIDPGNTPGSTPASPINSGNTPTVVTPPAPTVVTPPTPAVVTPPTPTVVTPPTPAVVTPPTPTVIDPPTPTVVTPPTPTVIDPPIQSPPTTTITPPVVTPPVIDPPVVNTPAIDPTTLPTNNVPLDPNSTINPINNAPVQPIDPAKQPGTPAPIDPNTPKAPVNPNAGGLPGNANSGNPNGMGNPNPGNPNGNPNPGNPNN